MKIYTAVAPSSISAQVKFNKGNSTGWEAVFHIGDKYPDYSTHCRDTGARNSLRIDALIEISAISSVSFYLRNGDVLVHLQSYQLR